MGIAFDSFAADDASSNVDATWDHAPVGTLAAIVVMVVMTNNTADRIVGVTADGVALTQETGSPRIHTAGADDSVISFWRLNNPPTGTLTIAVDVGPSTTTFRGVSVGLTVDDGGDVTVDTSNGNDTAAGTANSLAVTLATTAGVDTVCLFGFHSGEAAVNQISTDGTNLGEYDYGQQTATYAREDGAGGDVTVTMSMSSDTGHGFGFAYKSVANNDRRGQVSHVEMEVPDAPRRARVSHVEMETTDAPRRARVSYIEMEVTDAPRRGRVSFLEMEVPDPPPADRRGQVSHLEMEVPDAPRRVQVSVIEMEAPDAPRRIQVSTVEFEVPDAPRRVLVSHVEFEAPEPTADRRILVSLVELETPDAPRRARVSHVELVVWNTAADGKDGFVVWRETRNPHKTKRRLPFQGGPLR